MHGTQLENQAACKVSSGIDLSVSLALSILGKHAYTHRIADLNMRTQAVCKVRLACSILGLNHAYTHQIADLSMRTSY